MMAKEKGKRVNGMPVEAIKKMFLSPKTPPKLKVAWAKKLEKMGVKI